MSEASVVAGSVYESGPCNDGETNGGTARPPQNLLSVIADAESRQIIEVVADTTATASEIADSCNIPLSTTYRKLERLSELGLIEKRLRVQPSSHHSTEYEAAIDEMKISFRVHNGIEVTCG